MTAEPTEKHREEARELLPCPLCGSTNLFLRDIAGWELDCRGCELSLALADDPSREGLIARWNTRALSARDAEVREVLEGLVSGFDHAAWKGFNQSDSEFEKGYKHAMEVAARVVRETLATEKLQPAKETNDGD